MERNLASGWELLPLTQRAVDVDRMGVRTDPVGAVSASEEALPGGATLRDGNLLPVTAQRLVLGQIIRPSELAVAARFVVMQVEQIPDSLVQLAALRVPRQQELLGAGAAAKGRCVTYHAGGSASPAIA